MKYKGVINVVKELNIEMNIDLKNKKLYIGEENSSGAVYKYKDIKDLSSKIKFYLENYYTKEVEINGELLRIADDVKLIYEFLKEQSDTQWINSEKLKVLQDKGLVIPGDRPTDLIRKLDNLVEKIWDGLEDIPFYEEDSEQYIEENYLDFEKGTSKEDIWHWFDERHSKGIHYLLYEYEANNQITESRKCVRYTEINERIPLDKRDNELFYYECRRCGNETTVERNVMVDFSSTLITDVEILGDKEYIDIRKLFFNPKYIFLDDSDIHEKVINELNNEEIEEQY